MRTTPKNIFILMLTLAFLCGLAVPGFAASERGKISVALNDKNKNMINGTTVYACRIAELNSTGYYPVSVFEGSGISLSAIVNNPDEAAAKAIADYAKTNKVEALSKVSENGKVTFEDLDLGIWLLYCDESGKYKFNPYIVLLPFESGGALCYEVSSSPKVEDSNPDEINVYVVKKWDDKNNAVKKRPSEITVELLNGSTTVASAKLNEANGWSYTFYGAKKDGEYSVREKSVPDYKASYGGDAANGYVITNTYVGGKLPQTGQHWWPIVVIAAAGVGFVLLGIYEIGAKKNGKKK